MDRNVVYGGKFSLGGSPQGGALCFTLAERQEGILHINPSYYFPYKKKIKWLGLMKILSHSTTIIVIDVNKNNIS
ncbi:MAG: hypothetical protein LH615_04725 [Ferruginibacter sp.]|nr:hypothetical protein [Ferruginibacter sp.]